LTGAVCLRTLVSMNETEINMAFIQATEQWPRINWPRSAYSDHVTGVVRQGKIPKYLQDLYLAGAAGHRIDTAWEIIHKDIGPAVQNIMMRQPHANMAMEDLWSETVIHLVKNDHSRPCLPDGSQRAMIIRYLGLVKLINYCVTVASRIAIQKRRDSEREKRYIEQAPAKRKRVESNGKTSEQQVIKAEFAERIARPLAEAYAALSSEQQFLITMIYAQGMKQKEAGGLLGLSPYTTNRRVRDAIACLKRALRTIRVPVDAWNEVWREAWPPQGLDGT